MKLLALVRQTVTVSVVDGLGSIAHASLGEEVVDVALDGGFVDHEALRDLAVGETLGDEAEHFRLSRRETVREGLLGFVPPDGRGDDGLEEDVRSSAIIALGRDDMTEDDVAWLQALYPRLSSKLSRVPS